MSLKHQELYTRLNEKIAASHMRGRAKYRGIPEAFANPGRQTNNEAAIKQHWEETGHNIHPKYVQILEQGITNYQERLFLESWHLTLDKD